MRIGLDPLQVIHRPLFIYAGISAIHKVACLGMSLKGFTHGTSGPVLWHRLDKRNGPPDGKVVVLCHGLGVGFMPYIEFALQLAREDRVRALYVIELPHISSRFAMTFPSTREVVDGISDMLLKGGHDKGAHFIGHSYGTFVAAWCVQQRPEMVISTTLLDPVSLLIFMPDVVRNFMYRKPQGFVQEAIMFFIARELHASHTLTRQFLWWENVMWLEDAPKHVIVLLSGQDCVVPSAAIEKYVKALKPDAQLLLEPELGESILPCIVIVLICPYLFSFNVFYNAPRFHRTRPDVVYATSQKPHHRSFPQIARQ